MWRDLYQQLKVKSYKAGENVFNYNDIGDTFYIILSGTCQIRIPRYKEITCTPDYIEKYVQENLECLICMDNTIPQTVAEARAKSAYFCLSHKNEGKRDYKIRYLETIKTYGIGQHFGELALITSKPRSATVTWKIDTKLAYLNKHEYKKILGHAEYKKMLEITDFFKKYVFLNHLSIQALSKLIYSFQILSYNNGNYVFKQNIDRAEGIYLILEGDFQLIYTHNKKSQEAIKLFILSQGESFGLNEVFVKPHIYPFSVQWVSSTGRLYFLSNKIIDRLNTITKRKIAEDGQAKHQLIEERISEIFKFREKIRKPDPVYKPISINLDKGIDLWNNYKENEYKSFLKKNKIFMPQKAEGAQHHERVGTIDWIYQIAHPVTEDQNDIIRKPYESVSKIKPILAIEAPIESESLEKPQMSKRKLSVETIDNYQLQKPEWVSKTIEHQPIDISLKLIKKHKNNLRKQY